MKEFLTSPTALPVNVKPATKVMTRYTPNSGSGLQDT